MKETIKVGDKVCLQAGGIFHVFIVVKVGKTQFVARLEKDEQEYHIYKKTFKDDNFNQFRPLTPEIEEMIKTQHLWIKLRNCLLLLNDNFKKIPLEDIKAILAICDGIWPSSQKRV